MGKTTYQLVQDFFSPGVVCLPPGLQAVVLWDSSGMHCWCGCSRCLMPPRSTFFWVPCLRWICHTWRGLWESFSFEPPLPSTEKTTPLNLLWYTRYSKNLPNLNCFLLCVGRMDYEHRLGGKKQIDIQYTRFLLVYFCPRRGQNSMHISFWVKITSGFVRAPLQS